MGMPAIVLQDVIDLESIKEFVVLQLTFDALQRDIEVLENLRCLKLPEVYLKKLLAIRRRIVEDGSDMQAFLKTAGLIIADQKRTTTGIETVYVCRGDEYRCKMTWRFVRSLAAKKLDSYLG